MEILLIRYGLAAVFLGGALEGDATFILAGVVVQLNLLHLPSAIAVGTLGALTGDCTWYWFGRSGSARIHNSPIYMRAEPIASRLASRFGAWEIVVARFIFGARTASCVFWGTRRLSFAKFVVLDLIGCLTWVGLLITLGRLLSNKATMLIGEVRRIELWLLGTLILTISAFLILRIIFRHTIIARGQHSVSSDK
jgi:membrane protein DedA with SNARE-associated domain